MCLLLDMPTICEEKWRKEFEMVMVLSTCTKDFNSLHIFIP